MDSDTQPPAQPEHQKATAVLQGPKRQHFLPRFYLEGFARDGLVAVYDRELGAVRLQQPVNTGVIGHFYTMVDGEGRKRFELEQLLSEYEGKAKPAIQRLAARDDLDAELRSDLAIFIALGAMRTPDIVESIQRMNSALIERVMRRMYSSVEQVKEQLRQDEEYAGKSDEELEREATIMVQIAHQDGVVKTDSKWAVGMAIQLSLEIAPLLAGRDWLILHRYHESKSFVTTDAPVVLTTVDHRAPSFWGVGYADPQALIGFPLTQSCVLMMFGDSGDLRHRVADQSRMRQINVGMAARCKRFLVGRDVALVESLAKQANLASTKWRPKMQMG